MFRIDWQKWRGYALVMALAVAGTVALMPARPVVAQSAPQPRSLPDFTELVEQVGPAVVNIRTLEKARPTAQGGGQMDDEMQEFFRRFFGVPMPNVPRQRPGPRGG